MKNQTSNQTEDELETTVAFQGLEKAHSGHNSRDTLLK